MLTEETHEQRGQPPGFIRAENNGYFQSRLFSRLVLLSIKCQKMLKMWISVSQKRRPQMSVLSNNPKIFSLQSQRERKQEIFT